MAQANGQIVALIIKYNPDIIGVQEALHHQLQDFNRECRLLVLRSGPWRWQGKGEYSAILFRNSRFGLLDTKQTGFPRRWTYPEAKAGISRSRGLLYNRTVFDRQTKKNLSWWTRISIISKKLCGTASARIIKSYLTGAETGANVITREKIEIPVIVSGDFNSEPTEEPYPNMVDEKVRLYYTIRALLRVHSRNVLRI